MEDDEYDFNKRQEAKKLADENMQKMEQETKAWIETNENVKRYLDQFSGTWVESFVKDYPKVKARFVRYGNEVADKPEKQQIAYMEDASQRLLDVQLKKLFDVMCQWDAELITIEGINTSWDFFTWQGDLVHCPFITPVTEEEVNLYLQFLEEDDDWEKDDVLSISGYESFRGDGAMDENIPAWFAFENEHTGHDSYLSLPMLRTEKEEFYHSLYRKERDAQIEIKYETGELKRYVSDDRPMISIHTYADVERFVMQHETKDVLNAFRKYYDYFTDQLVREDPDDQEEGWLAERVTDIFYYLTDIKEKVPIEENEDWRQGLIDAYENYEKRKVIEAIPYAYNDYKMRIELKLDQPKKRKLSDFFIQVQKMNENILRGRELNGESRDFNF